MPQCTYPPTHPPKNPRPWYQIQRDLTKVGLDASGSVLGAFVYLDLRQNDRRALYLDQPGLGLAREHHLGEGEEADRRREAYLRYMVDTAVSEKRHVVPQ